jgi:hypothetical protein
LQNNVEDAAFAGDLVEAYKALAGQIIEFDMTFEVKQLADSLQERLYNEYISKNSLFNIGVPPYNEYNSNSWNGYLEKLFEAGNISSDLRVTPRSPNYGRNTIGIKNSLSENDNNEIVINLMHLGVFDYLRKNTPYNRMMPIAILITNRQEFDYYLEDTTYINNNLDVLKGALVIYKDDRVNNEDTQVYYILEDGNKSKIMNISELLIKVK